MLKKFNMDSGVKGAKAPMPTKVTLDLDPSGKEVYQKLYRSMIGSLLYLCASRPDIMLSCNTPLFVTLFKLSLVMQKWGPTKTFCN
jgi:hypothetical protein